MASQNKQIYTCTIQTEACQCTFGTKRALQEHEAQCRAQRAARLMDEEDKRKREEVAAAFQMLDDSVEDRTQESIYDQDYGIEMRRTHHRM